MAKIPSWGRISPLAEVVVGTRWFDMVIGRWTALDEHWPAPPSVTARDRAAVIGTWLVICVSLYGSNYGAREWGAWWPEAITGGDDRYWRKMSWAIGVFVTYMLPGAAWVRFGLGQTMADHGFNLRGFWRHLPIYLGCLAVVWPFVFLVSFDAGFQATYPMNKAAADSLVRLVGWELSYGLQFVGVEFLFRGLFLFGVARVLGGKLAVAAMVPAYLMLHFGKPPAEALGSVVAGLVMGTLALHSRSVAPGVVLHVAVAWSMDLLALYHTGRLGRLL